MLVPKKLWNLKIKYNEKEAQGLTYENFLLMPPNTIKSNYERREFLEINMIFKMWGKGGSLNDLNWHNQGLAIDQRIFFQGGKSFFQRRKEIKSIRAKLRNRGYKLKQFIMLSSRNFKENRIKGATKQRICS